jgi:hypothetical protein
MRTATCTHEAKCAILQAKAISIAIRVRVAWKGPNALEGVSEPLRHIVLNVTIGVQLKSLQLSLPVCASHAHTPTHAPPARARDALAVVIRASVRSAKRRIPSVVRLSPVRAHTLASMAPVMRVRTGRHWGCRTMRPVGPWTRVQHLDASRSL